MHITIPKDLFSVNRSMFIIFIMSQSRNKFIDRFKTQILKTSNNHSEQKTDRHLQVNNSSHIRSFNEERSTSNNKDIHQIIVKKLEKHIVYLEKKLKDAEQENERVKNLLDASQRKIAQSEIQQQGLIDQIEQLNQRLSRTEKDYEMIKSDYENLTLKQRMEKLTGQVNQRKEAYAKLELKHHQHKKGRFSSAFLPASFGVGSRCKERSSKEFEPIIKEFQLKNSEEKAALIQNDYNNRILNELKQVQEENDKFFKELTEMKIKNVLLQSEIEKNKQTLGQETSQKSLIQALKEQNEQLRQKLDEVLKQKDQALKQNKLFLNKLAANEEKMIEISMAISQRSQMQINHMLSSSASSLQQNGIRLEKQMQTQKLFNPETKESHNTKQLEERIEFLSRKLQEREEEMKQCKNQYKSEVSDLCQLMKKYSDHIDIDDSIDQTNDHKRYQIQKQPAKKQNQLKEQPKTNEQSNKIVDIHETVKDAQIFQ